MIEHPEHFYDLLSWMLLVSVFAAFTNLVQTTTLDLGKKVGKSLVENGISPTGLQDAITPKWQDRNNIISWVLLAVYLGVCIFVFKWYIGLIVFLLTYFILVPVISLLLKSFSMVSKIEKLIVSSLVKKAETYEAQGDDVRAEAAKKLSIDLNEIASR